MNQIINEEYSDLSFYYGVREEIKEHRKFYDNLIRKTENEDKSSFVKNGICFVGWFLVHRFDECTNVDKVAANIVDQGYDNKIDAIVETTDNELYLIQCKFSAYAESYARDNSGLKNVEELWNKLIGKDSFDNPNEDLEPQLQLIRKYTNDPAKRIVICLVIATDLVSGQNGIEKFRELKNKINNYKDSKYELCLYNDTRLKGFLSKTTSCADY